MSLPFDPFQMLGVPRTFDLPLDQLRAAHLTLASSLHPDLAQNHGQSDDETSRNAADLNRALHLLEDPERRANTLLELLGGPTKEMDRTLPPGFLMDIMETREAIESAVGSGDLSAIGAWQAWADERRADHVLAMSDLFRSLSTPPLPEQLRAIRTRLNEWRYIERLREQLDPGAGPARGDVA